jgi:hypothetical protein
MELAMTSRIIERRRASRRYCAGEHGIVSARVRPGKPVVIVDVSANGALIEASHRLLPGANVELHLDTADRRATIRGRMLRCHVARVRPTSVCYRGAIAFDSDLPWLNGDAIDGYTVHAAETRPACAHREEPTPQVI